MQYARDKSFSPVVVVVVTVVAKSRLDHYRAVDVSRWRTKGAGFFSCKSRAPGTDVLLFGSLRTPRTLYILLMPAHAVRTITCYVMTSLHVCVNKACPVIKADQNRIYIRQWETAAAAAGAGPCSRCRSVVIISVRSAEAVEFQNDFYHSSSCAVRVSIRFQL